MVRHNNVIPNQHFHKDWQNRVKTWFDQVRSPSVLGLDCRWVCLPAWGRQPLAFACRCCYAALRLLPLVVCVPALRDCAGGSAPCMAGGRRRRAMTPDRSFDRSLIDSSRVVWAGGGGRRLQFPPADWLSINVYLHTLPHPTLYLKQPAKKKARRLARKAKAAAIAPRPTQLLRPVVHAPTQRVRVLFCPLFVVVWCLEYVSRCRCKWGVWY